MIQLSPTASPNRYEALYSRFGIVLPVKEKEDSSNDEQTNQGTDNADDNLGSA